MSFYQVFVIYTEQSAGVQWGTVSTEGHITYVLKFMPHIFKHGGCDCSFISVYPCSKFQHRSA